MDFDGGASRSRIRDTGASPPETLSHPQQSCILQLGTHQPYPNIHGTENNLTFTLEGRPRKRRTAGASFEISEDVAIRPDSWSASSYSREGLDTVPELANPSHHATDAHILMILRRLATVEAKLADLSPVSTNNNPSPDIAFVRSILSPAMQASSDGTTYVQSGTTPIYNDQHTQRQGDVTELLSLRRNLAQPEDPPFGVWWTYTIEETLNWPILQFDGDINCGLDALMDSSDEEDSRSSDEDDSRSVGASLARRRERAPVGQVKRGLDDGVIVPELIESFLKNVHTKNPILDAAALRAYASAMIENGLSWDGETCQVLLACALGAVSYEWSVAELTDFSSPKTSPSRYALAQEYFSMAQKRLGNLWAHSSLIAAQCLFMAGWFLMYTQKPVAGWRAFNSASVACRTYISKRMASRNKALPMQDTHSMEQRLCWSCIKSEREIAVEFGMETSGLNLLAYSTTLPTPPNGYALDITSSSAAELSFASSGRDSIPPTPYEDRSWYYYLTEIMLRKLEMRIDIFCQEKRKEAYRRSGEAPESFFQSMVQALQEFDYQLTLYYESLPPVMKFPLEDLEPCSDELRHYLRWRLFSVRHDITIPALYILLHNDVSHWAAELVAELVRLANICLSLDLKFLRISITTHRYHATWLGPRKGVRSALILIAAGRLAARQVLGLEKLGVPGSEVWKESAKHLVRGLKYWSKESRDCSSYLEILRGMHPNFR